MTRAHITAVATSLLLAGSGLVSPVRAQDPHRVDPADSAETPRGGGWSFTPGIGYGGSWDDNVLVQGQGDATRSDYLNAITPRADVTFTSKRGEVSGAYDGTFIRYQDLNSLNSYDQHATAWGKRLLTKHTALVASNTIASSPTTELSELVGVPFVRTGSRVEELRTGVEAAFSKHTSLSATYNFEVVDFETDPASGVSLLGGHSHGASASLRRELNEHTALTADYNLQRATIEDGEAFNIHNAWAGADHRLSPSTRIFGSFGISRLGVSSSTGPQTGPAWRAGLSHDTERSTLDIAYIQSYVPSYSFGGTSQNEEVTAHWRVPIARRVYAQSTASWRKNQSLDPNGDQLKSFLVDGTVGYAVQPWLRLEGFFDGDYQSIARPGGRVNRNRMGIQLLTSKPMRIR